MTFAHGVHLQPRIRRTESGVLVVRRGLPGLGRLFRFERALFGIASDVLSSQGARFLRGVRRFLRSDDANAIEEAMPQASELWEPSQALFDKIFVAGRNSALEAIQAGAFSPEEWAILRDFLIANEFEYVKGINAKTRQAFTKAFIQWSGEDSRDMKALAKLLEPYVGPVRAEAIAVTEVNRAFNQAAVETWRAQGVVGGLLFLTAMDERVCDICRPLNGMYSPIQQIAFIHPGGDGDAAQYAGQAFPLPPLHPRCRCHVEPVPVEVAE